MVWVISRGAFRLLRGTSFEMHRGAATGQLFPRGFSQTAPAHRKSDAEAEEQCCQAGDHGVFGCRGRNACSNGVAEVGEIAPLVIPDNFPPPRLHPQAWKISPVMTRLRADLLLLACAAVWGFAFLCQKRAMEHVGPFSFVAIRSVLACFALAPLVVRECRRMKAAKGCLPLTELFRVGGAAGVAFFAAAALQQTGLVTASVTNCGFLTALYVVITPFLAWLMVGQKPGPWIWVAAVLSFLGTWLLGGGSLAMLSRGDWLVAASASLWALHVVITGIGARLDMVATFTAFQFVVVALLAGITASFSESLSLTAMVKAAPDLLYVGILSSAVTFTLLAVALRATRAAEATVILSTESLFAAFGAYLFLGERLQVIGWFGAGTIFIATLVVQMPGRSAVAKE